MESSQSLCYPVIIKFLDPKEESLSDMDFDVFDLVLNANDIVGLKNQILEEFRVKGDAFNLVESSLVHYCLP